LGLLTCTKSVMQVLASLAHSHPHEQAAVLLRGVCVMQAQCARTYTHMHGAWLQVQAQPVHDTTRCAQPGCPVEAGPRLHAQSAWSGCAHALCARSQCSLRALCLHLYTWVYTARIAQARKATQMPLTLHRPPGAWPDRGRLRRSTPAQPPHPPPPAKQHLRPEADKACCRQSKQGALQTRHTRRVADEAHKACCRQGTQGTLQTRHTRRVAHKACCRRGTQGVLQMRHTRRVADEAAKLRAPAGICLWVWACAYMLCACPTL